MFPHALHLGPLSINLYGFMVSLGVLAAFAVFNITAPWRQIEASRARDFCFWMIVVGLMGSRFFYVLFHLHQFHENPWSVLAYWQGGLMFQGGVIAALIAAPFFLKRYSLFFWPTADVMAPSLALGQCLGRLGCFSVGCCYGRVAPSDAWAVIFPEDSLAISGLPLYPTQLYESFGLLLITIFLLLLLKKEKFSGVIAGTYLFMAGLLRLFIEHYRGDFRGEALFWDMPPTTITAAAAILLGLFIIFYRKRQIRLNK